MNLLASERYPHLGAGLSPTLFEASKAVITHLQYKSPMINIQVKLYGTLRRYRPSDVEGSPHQPFVIELPAAATVLYLLSQLGIEQGMASAIAVNSEATNEGVQLHDGDDVRLFPPSAGGDGMRIFIAGIMQGSREDHLIDAQDYRNKITQALEANVPNVQISDPYALHPDSIHYEIDQVRDTFESFTVMVREADVVIAYLPKASMGTAIEMWTALKSNKPVIAVTPLTHNWVVRLAAQEVLPDLDSLIAAINDGLIGRLTTD